MTTRYLKAGLRFNDFKYSLTLNNLFVVARLSAQYSTQQRIGKSY